MTTVHYEVQMQSGDNWLTFDNLKFETMEVCEVLLNYCRQHSRQTTFRIAEITTTTQTTWIEG